ncbi:MAG: hypothetical protein IJK23_01465 [Clostridia bacterium]|nr:hypothetical protein [Clostridia bacterium]
MKEKKARMEIRLSEKDKKTIERYSKKCGVPVSEFVRQCALGFSPRQALPDDFYDLYSCLCDVCNLVEPGFTEETERELISLITDIREQLLLPGKEALLGPPQNQRFCGEKEQPRNGEPFVAGDKSEGMECDATWQPPASGP